MALPPRIGKRLGKYLIEAELGRGGMGVVYRARHVMLDRTVAIKVVSDSLSADVDGDGMKRFRREAQAVARLNHPNIVQVFDIEEVDDLTYLVMEYVPGEGLDALVKRKVLSHEQSARIAADIAGALSFAHGMGVLHRDIKPENILLTATRQVKVADFGIAYLLDTDKGYTKTGVLVGSPHYMSPEQCQGMKLDGRSDLYALGVVLYRMLTGILPFQTDSSLQVLMKKISEAPKDPRDLVPDLPEELANITRRALKTRPEDRFASMREMRNALLGYLGEKPDGDEMEASATRPLIERNPDSEETAQVSGITALVTPSGSHPASTAATASRTTNPASTRPFAEPVREPPMRRREPAPAAPPPSRSSALPWILTGACLVIAVAAIAALIFYRRVEAPPATPSTSLAPTAVASPVVSTSPSPEATVEPSAAAPATSVAVDVPPTAVPVPPVVPTEVPTAVPTAPVPTAVPTAVPAPIVVPTQAPQPRPTRASTTGAAPREDAIELRISGKDGKASRPGRLCFTEGPQGYRYPTDSRRPDAEQIRIRFELDPPDPVAGERLVIKSIVTNGSDSEFFIDRFEESDPTGASAPSGLALVKSVAPGQAVELRKLIVDVKTNTNLKRSIQVVDGKQGVWTRTFELGPCP